MLAYNATIDKMIGDEVMAYWIPLGSAGHRRDAVMAARDLIIALKDRDTGEPWLPVGIGVHAGLAFVGKIGGAGVDDFTVLGDTVNTASRIQAESASGEILISLEL